MNSENLTDGQLKFILQQISFTMLMRKQKLTTYIRDPWKEDEELTEFYKNFNCKSNFVDMLSDRPKMCKQLLFCIPEYFNADLKIKLIRYAAKDRESLLELLHSNYGSFKTIAVQSELMQIVKNDDELIIDYAKSMVDNYKIKDLKEYIKKLKISKEDRNSIETALIAAKMM